VRIDPFAPLIKHRPVKGPGRPHHFFRLLVTVSAVLFGAFLWICYRILFE
jgi:hypothetical protein